MNTIVEKRDRNHREPSKCYNYRNNGHTIVTYMDAVLPVVLLLFYGVY